ncbi:site-specific integrase [Listeria newyorkensis]|uniref:Site-specific integrase n=1 Tax=Listeria newyorkensis TaxID=1497681 RepID=A0A841Z154_9LIST|nr:site-specific integrase [Listeria newyorkensis]MBC1459318.1 site-specific integrase [Listeria newyorkensis]
MASIQKYETKAGEKWLFKAYTAKNKKTGRKDRVTRRGFDTYEEAVIAASEFEKESVGRSSEMKSENILFKEVYLEWWDIHKKTIKPSTQEQYLSLFKNHVLPVLGKWRIKGITKQDAQKFITDLIATDLVRSTVQNIKIKTAQVFQHAAKMDYVDRNVFEHVVVPRKEEDFFAIEEAEEKRQFWYAHELTEILSIFEKDFPYSTYALFRLLAYAGLRKGEALALKTADIDFKKNGIKVNKTLYFYNHTHTLMKPKTKSSVRFIPLDVGTMDVLRKHLSKVNDMLVEAAENHIELENEGFLFIRNDGRPLRLTMPNDELNKLYVAHPKLPKIKIHGFRHTYASILFAEGKAPKRIQSLLGHKSIQTTMDIYTHIHESWDDNKEKKKEDIFHFI